MLRRAALVVLSVVFLPATVQAFDHHHHHDLHGEADGGHGCGSSHADSSSSSSGEATPTASSSGSPAHKRVFVTSTLYAGALGGLEAADQFCADSAASHGLTGQYAAWISSSRANALDRVNDVGPWYTMRDELAFASKDALGGAPLAALADETGAAPATPVGVWSGTDAAGAATSDTCEDWTNATANATATTGSARADDAAWGGGGATIGCDQKAALICFEQ